MSDGEHLLVDLVNVLARKVFDLNDGEVSALEFVFVAGPKGRQALAQVFLGAVAQVDQFPCPNVNHLVYGRDAGTAGARGGRLIRG